MRKMEERESESIGKKRRGEEVKRKERGHKGR